MTGSVCAGRWQKTRQSLCALEPSYGLRTPWLTKSPLGGKATAIERCELVCRACQESRMLMRSMYQATSTEWSPTPPFQISKPFSILDDYYTSSHLTSLSRSCNRLFRPLNHTMQFILMSIELLSLFVLPKAAATASCKSILFTPPATNSTLP